jgi:riboflavin transporter FmnP
MLYRVPVMPAAPFLKYDPKDIVIVIGGFLFGPLQAAAIALTAAFVEMVTVSETGLPGMLMNALSSAAFACSAAAIYKRRRSLAGAVVGLCAACATVTGIMMLWNYIVTPMYMGVPRTIVASMLLPVFLPFNLIKYVLNAAAAMVLYKPVAAALSYTGARRAGDESTRARSGRPSPGVLAVSVFVMLSAVLLILILQGKI